MAYMDDNRKPEFCDTVLPCDLRFSRCVVGLTLGAACTLSTVKEELEKAVQELDQEKSKVYQALLQTLHCLAGKQIRNLAVSPYQSTTSCFTTK